MILHLTDDQKFINGAYSSFEEYYPGKNHFFVQVPRKSDGKAVYVIPRDRLFFKSFTNKKDLTSIVEYAQKKHIKHVLIHYLSPTKAALANDLKKYLNIKTYWIFYGADLYSWLQREGKYSLSDTFSNRKKKFNIKTLKENLIHLFLHKQSPNRILSKFIYQLNYFCFWNEYDYLLLKKHYKTNAAHKFFIYYHLLNRSSNNFNFKKSQGKILLNHSASGNGNHKTILNKLKHLNNDLEIKEIIAPLSYGNEFIKTDVLQYGKLLFGERFYPLLDFLPMEKYYQLLNDIPVAIFGNRRQEGAGNIFYLLDRGTKVFLRNDNNMISWLRDHGFKVFSFEDELHSTKDLQPLSREEMKINHSLHSQLFSKEQEIKNMKKLIDT